MDLREAIESAGGLLTVTEIGRRYDVSTARASEMAQRDDFPRPVAYIGSRPVWAAVDVDAWRAAPRRPGPRA